jgi:hypothetical protein
MIQLNKVIINGVYETITRHYSYLIAQAKIYPYSNIKENVLYKQPIKRNNNLMRHQPSC